MTEPMLPKGQKMRRTAADGYEVDAKVEASSTDWAIIRTVAAVQANTVTLRLRPPDPDSGAIRDENGHHWVPVVEPATWDVVGDVDEDWTLDIAPTDRPLDGAAIQIDLARLPDLSIADDLAHFICELMENWSEWGVLDFWVGRHRAAQTEREAQS